MIDLMACIRSLTLLLICLLSLPQLGVAAIAELPLAAEVVTCEMSDCHSHHADLSDTCEVSDCPAVQACCTALSVAAVRAGEFSGINPSEWQLSGLLYNHYRSVDGAPIYHPPRAD